MYMEVVDGNVYSVSKDRLTGLPRVRSAKTVMTVDVSSREIFRSLPTVKMSTITVSCLHRRASSNNYGTSGGV